jgi:hypothetical protein
MLLSHLTVDRVCIRSMGYFNHGVLGEIIERFVEMLYKSGSFSFLL